MNLRFFFFLVSSLVLSCSSLQPRPENAVGVLKSVYDGDEEKQGDLFLQEDGLWAYVGEELPNQTDEGTLLFYGTSDDSHSFAVVENNPWGMLLQRLDSENLDPRQSEEFVVSDMSLRDQQSWPICTTKKCLKEYRPGVVFHLYARNKTGELVPSKESGLRFPRKGIARISANEIVVDGVMPDSFLAVASTSQDYPTKGRISNEGCTIVNEDINQLSNQSFPKSQTPVDISLSSVEKSVDAFIRCRDGETAIAIPGLWRAHHPMAFGTFNIAPLVSAQVYTFSTPSAAGLEQLSKFMLAVGTGDFTGADFWLDRFADSHPEKTYRPFLKNAAEISTAAGRPENAVRLLKVSTTGYWNPENDGRWNTVRYRIDKMVGTPRNAILRYSKLPEFFEKEEDPILDFLTFFSLREERSQNREVGKPSYIGEKEKWKLATEVDRHLEFLGRQKPEVLPAEVIQALALFERDTKNPFDIFGRTPTTLLSSSEILLRGTSQTLAKKPISWSQLNEPKSFSKNAYFFDQLSSDDKNEFLSELIASHETPETCSSHSDSVLYTELSLRLDRDVDENELLLWYFDKGIPNKCEGEDAFIASAKDAGGDIDVIGPSILGGILKKDRFEYQTAKNISAFAIRNARGPSCEDFHTAFAFALFKRNNAIEAQAQLNNAAKCIDAPRPDLSTLLAFALFERTGEIEGSAETQRKLTQAVGATKNDCPGNLPLDYQFDYLVSAETNALAKRFTFEKQGAKTIQFEKTGNAVNDGKSAISATAMALNRGDFPAVLLSLKEAETAYVAARFFPGLHRVRFLKTHLTKSSKKKEAGMEPSKTASMILAKKELEKSATNTILLKILRNQDLRESKHPDLCNAYTIPTKKLVIEQPKKLDPKPE